jgi:alpha-amylase/alpha-mannosidase (GH57 family)
MPWVRFHALKDYLDMPLLAASFDRVRVTFNLVPSLLDQIEMYVNGAIDRHLELSRMRAEDLTPALKVEILETFFSANPDHLIKPFHRYWELYQKARREDANRQVIASFFSSAEMRDLQVWSNLAWVDPMFRSDPIIKDLLARDRQFSEEEKHRFLDWQIEHMRKIIPTYRRLLEEDRIDISFTPYFHPILPLLCDTQVARESLPDILLPQRRFRHPEDAARQIQMSRDRYRACFGRELAGMWPSEGSVSTETLDIMLQQGISWTATDEEILYHSLIKSSQEPGSTASYSVFEYGAGIKLFFRDHGLSDRVGFVYSGWKADRAAVDFINHLKEIRAKLAGKLHESIVSVILDGENAWEYFPDDGTEFLTTMYRLLNEDPLIETVTMSQAAGSIPAHPLKSIFAGSWINHNFRIWIGHAEDNAAWDLLSATRDTLVQFERENPDFDKERVAAAWLQVFIAEGSDWCWWYGDDHRTAHIEQFDRTYRRHLAAVYEFLGLEVPPELLRPILQGAKTSHHLASENLISPDIDGLVSHFYEWAGAAGYDCLKAGAAMHQVTRFIGTIQAGFDRDNVYIRLDFHNRMGVELLSALRFVIDLRTPEPLQLPLVRNAVGLISGETDGVRYRMDEILEVSLKRSLLWPTGVGRLGIRIMVMDGEQLVESCPDGENLTLDVPSPQHELFWPE